MYEPYSVLMSVYSKECPEWLEKSVRSMMNQTVPCEEFILICDGPLTPDLETAVKGLSKEYGSKMRIIRLSNNQGLAAALAKGIQECHCDLVARMDSDDIAVPERCEKQLSAFLNNSEIDLLSAYISEFMDDPSENLSIRCVPVNHEEICKYSRYRNPMNHMAVMYRKSSVIASGNYEKLPFFEDYDLWVRILKNGGRAYNIPEVLVHARIGNGMYERRGGINYVKSILILEKRFLKYGWINKKDYFLNCLIRITISLCPVFIRKIIYRRHLRK